MHVLTVLMGLATVVLPSIALPHAIRSDREFKFPDQCQPDPCAGITFQNDSYVCGDPRLGPVKAPKMFPLNNELRSYERFGSLCPAAFLQKWAGSASPDASYKYPPAMGYFVDTAGAPIIGNATLPVGQKLDRFGSEYGNFLSPLGAPFIERALPPSNLNTYDGAYPFNYHVYQVTRSFVVGMGPIAPWFEQPGGGTQYVTYTNVKGLLAGGYLRRLTPDEYDEPREYSDGYTPGPSPVASRFKRH